jgi:hypothetical protein
MDVNDMWKLSCGNVGHMYFGSSHPNETDPINRGVATLFGTDHTKRFMDSLNDSNSRLTVKKEWDKAEEWLKANIDTPTP